MTTVWTGKNLGQLGFVANMATILLILVGCHRDAAPLDVSILLQNPHVYDRKLVSVHGCYMNGIEVALLTSCTKPSTDQSIWIEPYANLEAKGKLIPGYHGTSTKPEVASPRERQFQNDLVKMPDSVLVEVVFRGEFQHSEEPSFGHAPGRRNQLILYRVLELATH